MSKNKINQNSTIKFHKLAKKGVPDKKGFYVVSRIDTDKTLKVENDAYKAIDYLGKGVPLVEVSRLIKRKKSEVLILVNTLMESGFVKSVDGLTVPDTYPKIRPFKFFLTKSQLQFLNSKYLWIAVLVLISVGFLISVTSPELSPSFHQFFWTKNILVVYVSLFFLETLFIVLHEFIHFIVTIAVGGSAVVRISNRFVNLVAETESYGLSLVDKSRRYLVYLSAMAFNLSIISIIYILLKQSVVPLNPSLRPILLSIVLLNIQGVIWQFNLFLQTDLYNFLSDFLENDNLHNNSILFIITKLNQVPVFRPILKLLQKTKSVKRIISESDDPGDLVDSEKKQLTFYSILFLVGIILVVFQYLSFVIPRDLFYISTSLRQIYEAIKSNNILNILSSFLLIFLVSWKYVALIIVRNRKQH